MVHVKAVLLDQTEESGNTFTYHLIHMRTYTPTHMHPSMSSHTQTHTAMLSKDFSALNASRILNTFFFS